MIRTAIKPLQQVVELDVDGDVRSFVIREQSVARATEFLRKFDSLRQDAAKADAADLLVQTPEMWEQVAGGSEDVLLWLLSTPVEGGRVADQEWVHGLTLSQRRAVIDLQAKLNSLEDIAPNFLAILRLLHAGRMARLYLSDGEMNGSGGRSPIDSQPSTDSTPTT